MTKLKSHGEVRNNKFMPLNFEYYITDFAWNVLKKRIYSDDTQNGSILFCDSIYDSPRDNIH